MRIPLCEKLPSEVKRRVTVFDTALNIGGFELNRISFAEIQNRFLRLEGKYHLLVIRENV